MCSARLLLGELGTAVLRPSALPLRLQQDQKVPANRAASVLYT